jgi:hypothetical protein
MVLGVIGDSRFDLLLFSGSIVKKKNILKIVFIINYYKLLSNNNKRKYVHCKFKQSLLPLLSLAVDGLCLAILLSFPVVSIFDNVGFFILLLLPLLLLFVLVLLLALSLVVVVEVRDDVGGEVGCCPTRIDVLVIFDTIDLRCEFTGVDTIFF